ncbi:MAG: ribonuclease Z [Candidatus Aenigmatarchaeota archaeon]
MLEIVFLGTGSGIPSKARNLASIWLRYEDSCFLWDCAEGTQRQLMSAKLSFMKVNRIFITHWHADHWAGLIGLLMTMNMERRTAPLHIYGPEAERFVSDILDLGYWGPRYRIVPHDVPYEGSEITSLHKEKRFEISSTPVLHTVPSVAYCFKERDSWNVDIKKAEKRYGLKQSPLVGKLKQKGQVTYKGKTIRLEDVGILNRGVKVVYSGDTKICKSLEKLSRGADILIQDATFESEKEGRMHSGAKEAAQLAKRAGVKKLVLTHFSRRYVNVKPLLEEAQKVFPDTMAARDFLRLTLKKAPEK